MPIRKKPFTPRRNSSLRLILSAVVLFLLIAGAVAAVYLTQLSQDVRQQAATYSCAEELVNTQFRPYEAGTDKPWVDGAIMTTKVGDKIDVNCFAKTGSALLSNAKITLKIDGVTTTIPSSTVLNNGATLRAYTITKAGVHAFTCANTASCSNTDQIAIAQTPVVCTADAKVCPDGSSVGRVGPNCEFAACPQAPGTCANPSAADINRDCAVDLKDYDLFLSEFIKRQSL